MFSLISAWINGWVNIREAGDLRRDRAHYDVIVMGQAVMGCSGFVFPPYFVQPLLLSTTYATMGPLPDT